jgi:hypothetical protein
MRARTYNQNHVARAHTGGRRISIYWTWSYPWESQRDPAEAGNSEFNALIWMPPAGRRAGDIVLIDSTHFTTLFGGTDSLKSLWHNLATMK